MALLWLGTFALVLVLILVDLFVVRRQGLRAGVTWSLGVAVAYLFLAMLANVGVYWAYDTRFLGAGVQDSYTEALTGHSASLQYLTSFVLELTLTLDSAFVIAAVLVHFRVRTEYHHRLLLWGLLIALVFRAGLILGIGALVHSFDWFRFVLAGGLVLAAIRMTLVRQENLDPERHTVVRLIKKVVPLSREQQGSNLLTTQDGRPALTPLMVPVLIIETADAFMALDSIPASYSVTREPFLIFLASAFALLIVRSAMPALTLVLGRLRYFKIGLAMVLAYSAVVIALPASRSIPGIAPALDELRSATGGGWTLTTLQKLGFVGVGVLFGVLVALLLGTNQRTEQASAVSPLGEEADRVARQTLTGVRKVVVFVLGITGVVVGAVMAIGPGPGIPILFIAALLLASEFVWARVLVNKYRGPAEAATLKAAAHIRRRFAPWKFGALLGAEVLIVVLLIALVGWPAGLVITAALPLLLGQCFMLYLAYIRKPPDQPPPALPPPPT